MSEGVAGTTNESVGKLYTSKTYNGGGIVRKKERKKGLVAKSIRES